MADELDVARADFDAAAAEMAMACDALIARLQLLGDRRAAELLARVMTTVEGVISADKALTDAALALMQNLFDKQLAVLGSNRSDAARRLLEAAGLPAPRKADQ